VISGGRLRYCFPFTQFTFARVFANQYTVIYVIFVCVADQNVEENSVHKNLKLNMEIDVIRSKS